MFVFSKFTMVKMEKEILKFMHVLEEKPTMMACAIVKPLLSGLHGKGHMVVTDNYFVSVDLFMELAS